MDLVSNALGSDFIPHGHPSPMIHTEPETNDDHHPHQSTENAIKRVDSDEEDKGLIREELLSKRNDNVDGNGDDDDEVEPIQLPPPPETTSKTISILLQDFLILRIENGRDYFLTITANFSPTLEGKFLFKIYIFV